MNWTKDELIAYILLYLAHANFEEPNHERNIIISKVDMKTFQKIHDEFDSDNDYQSIQKIIEGIKSHNFNEEDMPFLFSEMKSLFLSDGEFDVMEQNLFMYLKKLLA